MSLMVRRPQVSELVQRDEAGCVLKPAHRALKSYRVCSAQQGGLGCYVADELVPSQQEVPETAEPGATGGAEFCVVLCGTNPGGAAQTAVRAGRRWPRCRGRRVGTVRAPVRAVFLAEPVSLARGSAPSASHKPSRLGGTDHRLRAPMLWASRPGHPRRF